jgi:hypothetical protein
LDQDLLGLCLCARQRALGFLARSGAHLLGFAVNLSDRGYGLVPGGLGLRAGGVEDLPGLLLGCLYAVGRSTVGLGDPLPGTRLGLLPQLRRRAFGSLDDIDHLRGHMVGLHLANGRPTACGGRTFNLRSLCSMVSTV